MADDLDSRLVLPDSRLKDPKGVVRAQVDHLPSMNWVPIYCANCGVKNGYVPEENMDFVCWLCPGCSDKWGEQFGYAAMPDEVFWKKAELEMLEKYGRILTPTELEKATETSSALTTLLREGIKK